MNANMPDYPRTGVGNAGTMFDVPPQDGLTKREHAAILLRVPMSGDAEIDAMIIAANRKDAAAMCLQGLLANPLTRQQRIDDEIIILAYKFADLHLAEPVKEQA